MDSVIRAWFERAIDHTRNTYLPTSRKGAEALVELLGGNGGKQEREAALADAHHLVAKDLYARERLMNCQCDLAASLGALPALAAALARHAEDAATCAAAAAAVRNIVGSRSHLAVQFVEAGGVPSLLAALSRHDGVEAVAVAVVGAAHNLSFVEGARAPLKAGGALALLAAAGEAHPGARDLAADAMERIATVSKHPEAEPAPPPPVFEMVPPPKTAGGGGGGGGGAAPPHLGPSPLPPQTAEPAAPLAGAPTAPPPVAPLAGAPTAPPPAAGAAAGALALLRPLAGKWVIDERVSEDTTRLLKYFGASWLVIKAVQVSATPPMVVDLVGERGGGVRITYPGAFKLSNLYYFTAPSTHSSSFSPPQPCTVEVARAPPGFVVSVPQEAGKGTLFLTHTLVENRLVCEIIVKQGDGTEPVRIHREYDRVAQ
jgi:hypothetical protein